MASSAAAAPPMLALPHDGPSAGSAHLPILVAESSSGPVDNARISRFSTGMRSVGIPSGRLSLAGYGHMTTSDGVLDEEEEEQEEESYDEEAAAAAAAEFDDAAQARPTAPAHPIESMQGAFEESLVEVTDGSIAAKPKLRMHGDAKSRREALIEQKAGEETTTAAWRRRPGQRYHELWKLMAQISFGVCLLLADLAKIPAEVVNILQGHIDEVDEFLEVTMEDLDEAVQDMSTRIRHLQLPMDNLEFFENMLENREYRAQVVDGNLIIEHIISRTRTTLDDWNSDIDQGLRATADFTAYLDDQQDGPWRDELQSVVDIFDAMKSNVEGWHQTFLKLQNRTSTLNSLLVKLGNIITEVDRRAGEASRRTRFTIPPFTVPELMAAGEEGSPQSTPRATPPSSGSQRSRQSRLSQKAASSSSRGSQDGPGLRRLSSDPGSNHSSGNSNGSSASTAEQPVRTKRDTATAAFTASQPPLHELEAESVVSSSSSSARPIADGPQQIPPTVPERSLARRPTPSLMVDVRDPFADPEQPATASIAAPISAVDDDVSAAPFYLLQPRTYTPQPPAPLPSPMVQSPPSPRWDAALATVMMPPPPAPHPASANYNNVNGAYTGPTLQSPVPQRASQLRQRVSLRTNPPEAIVVPDRDARDSRGSNIGGGLGTGTFGGPGGGGGGGGVVYASPVNYAAPAYHAHHPHHHHQSQPPAATAPPHYPTAGSSTTGTTRSSGAPTTRDSASDEADRRTTATSSFASSAPAAMGISLGGGDCTSAAGSGGGGDSTSPTVFLFPAPARGTPTFPSPRSLDHGSGGHHFASRSSASSTPINRSSGAERAHSGSSMHHGFVLGGGNNGNSLQQRFGPGGAPLSPPPPLTQRRPQTAGATVSRPPRPLTNHTVASVASSSGSGGGGGRRSGGTLAGSGSRHVPSDLSMMSSSTMPVPSTIRGYSGGIGAERPGGYGSSNYGPATPSVAPSKAPSAAGTSKTLKKKKSAFGWLKKAFSLDDEERAAFEQRRQAPSQGASYFEHDDGPRFLDGRRIG